MQDEWTQDKLSLNTKQTLANIFRELDCNHIQEAFDMHITLVRNASSEVYFSFSCFPREYLILLQVVRFIVGIKRFIQELQRLSN